MFTDSKSLFDVIKIFSTTAEKRLMIDIKSVRISFNAHDITNVVLVRSETSPVDSFTKIWDYSSLDSIIEENNCNFLI